MILLTKADQENVHCFISGVTIKNNETYVFNSNACNSGLTLFKISPFYFYVLVLEFVAVTVTRTTVLPARSDGDVMFCLQSYKGLLIDRSLVYYSYPQDRINTQVIYQFALDEVACTSYLFT